MRKFLIAALLIAAGCDSTRRDFKYCNAKYNQCDKGFTCNLTTELCEPDVVDAPVDRIQPSEVMPPLDVTAGEVAADTRDAPVIDVTPGEVGGIDGADAPLGVDLALPDTRVPDAAGTCAGDSDCTSAGATVCVNFRCVACRTSAQCGGATPFCSATNTCVSCASAPGGDAGVCSGTTPVCDPGSGRCVECTQNTECRANASKSFCVANQCQGCNVPGASASIGSADGGVADGGSSVDAGVVGPCLGATPRCATSGTLSGQCVQCLSSTDCSGPTPICNTSNTCEKCTTDKQCADKGVGPGVCMYHDDGRCALDQETWYVQNSSGCSGGTGTAASPFCRPQDALNAITTSRRVVVLTGGAALAEFVVSRNDSPVVSIIGRQNPMIGVGAANKGIHIQKGKVFVRGVRIEGAGVNATEPGIVVESGATLALDGGYVRATKGGLRANDGAGFDIANSVFALNLSANVDAAMYGGVYLGRPGTGLPRRFWFNTIADNDQVGIACADGSQRLEAILFWQNAGGDVANCSVPPGTLSGTTAPNLKAVDGFVTTIVNEMKFSTMYRLSAQSPSPCRDWITTTATNHPPLDIDGDPRPYPGTGKLDCGADEYRP